jgi:outer membrane lipoprotein-sorting protein
VNLSRSFLICSIATSLALALLPCATARAANAAPAIAAFDQAFAGVNDYTCILHVHEAKGTATQDRVYQYSFMKPHYAKTLILDGDGKGSGGVWVGTDQISGHQGLI